MTYLIKFLKTKKALLFLIILATVIQSFSMLAVPYFAAKMIDDGILKNDLMAIVRLGLQMLAAVGLSALISLWASYMSADLAALSGKYLRDRIFDKTQILSIRDFNHFSTASMITRATGDITVIQQTVIMLAQMVLPAPIIAVTAIIMTIAVSPKLVAIPILAMVFFMLGIYVIFIKASPISKTIQMRLDSINRIMGEAITGVRVIRAFDNSEFERNRTNAAFLNYANNVIKLNKTFAVFSPLIWSVVGISLVAVLWFGSFLVLNGEIQVGGITAVSEYTILLLIALIMSSMVMVMLPKMKACLDRTQEVLDTIPEINDVTVPQSRRNPADPFKIVFDQVSFSYRGAEEAVLKEISFACEQGKTTAIIGGTGSGKSTIASLMLRLYDVASGTITLEGVDIRQISQHELRENISYVPQKALLFSGTIADNLRMGNSRATQQELEQAAQTAQAHDFIMETAEGYQRSVAQGGTNFSGGQKQRLCIARALVKKAPVYIFDDSFSALDFKTDAALRQALKKEMASAAVVIVAQRVSTIIDADQIIVLEAGRMAGIGRHAELINTCLVYQEIVASQLCEKEVGSL
ncbi:ABC transporter ATP-binding protein/permease [Acetobacterium wieringae]|uniref:ABC transporter ATP-binding protein/permease n=1 Tax=Acetobacterium wieringae TaxID=52694 RepID=A0ABY6HEM2_9FIRM|nr:ABC transporter ATP-binding protein [Acetobacterium wieringae]UYO62993.1 ABC transporter ATP-binding protein/permease [Acetobacterium wieringae]VUZ22821.1 putative ABC transporter ATP-binding protein [Acetobacterium wieringae]